MKKRQKKASKAELLQDAEKKAAEREQLAGSAEGQVGFLCSQQEALPLSYAMIK